MEVAFIRMVEHGLDAGHFETLRTTLFTEANVRGVNMQFWDFSELDKSTLKQYIESREMALSMDHFFFEWLHDIADISAIDNIVGGLGVTWSVIASMSEVWDSKLSSEFQSRLDELSRCESLKTIFVWDKFASIPLSKWKLPLLVIPDSQNIEVDDKLHDCCKWLKGYDGVVIGVVGQLYGYRGVTNIIRIAIKNPRFKYILWGLGKWKTVSRADQMFLKFLKRIGVVFVSDDYKESEADLNHAFLHLTALYLDGSRYFNPSGIVTRARHFGIPVLLEEGRGYYSYISRIDKGIIQGRYLRIRRKEIVRISLQNKETAFIESPTISEQVDALIYGWSESSERS